MINNRRPNDRFMKLTTQHLTCFLKMSDSSTYDYESLDPEPTKETVDKVWGEAFFYAYLAFAALACVGIVLAFVLSPPWDSYPDTCPDSLTFWVTWNSWLHVVAFVIWVSAAIMVKCGLFGTVFMTIDVILVILGATVGSIGSVQVLIGLYKSIGHDCDNATDLAFWQIVLFSTFVRSMTIHRESTKNISNKLFGALE